MLGRQEWKYSRILVIEKSSNYPNFLAMAINSVKYEKYMN